MLYQPFLGANFSGSLGAITGSHARSVHYFRARHVPIDPNTARQQQMRIAMTGVSEDWGTLGTEYWDAWASFANNVRRINRLGQAHNRTGFNEYVRWASTRTFANAVLGTDLPLFPAVPTGPQVQIDFPITVAITDGGTIAHWQVNPDVPFMADSDNALLIWCGSARGAIEPPTPSYMQPTHHYWRGPWLLAGMIRGEGSEELNLTLDNAMVPSQKLAWKARLTTRYQGMSGIVGGHVVAP